MLFRSASFQTAQAEAKRYLRIMYEVTMMEEMADWSPVTDWSVAGHSLGARTAMKVAGETSPGTSKLVLWGQGGGPSFDLPIDLSSLSSTSCIVLNGSEDGLINRLSETYRKDFNASLPPDTLHKTIQGGNHNGFGHYEKPGNEKFDGKRTITLDEIGRAHV